jgi:hypothetical protein
MRWHSTQSTPYVSPRIAVEHRVVVGRSRVRLQIPIPAIWVTNSALFGHIHLRTQHSMSCARPARSPVLWPLKPKLRVPCEHVLYKVYFTISSNDTLLCVRTLKKREKCSGREHKALCLNLQKPNWRGGGCIYGTCEWYQAMRYSIFPSAVDSCAAK